jgi:PTH1 family peptidyl-tRNA hydrolase
MYLIAGLGNPGNKYTFTRHNVGFLVIDEIAKSTPTLNIDNSNFKAIVLKTSNKLLVKPQTFMNKSGESILPISDYYDILNKNIIIIHDDLDLSFGSVKFKIGGGNAGHNGLRSIDDNIDKNYIRVRIGIGKPQNKEDVSCYVLNKFTKDELNQLNDIITHTIKAIDAIMEEDDLQKIKSTFTIK